MFIARVTSERFQLGLMAYSIGIQVHFGWIGFIWVWFNDQEEE